MKRTGKFITFEGVEGAGKSTQIPIISNWLSSQGIENLTTREPGGAPLSEKIRALLLLEEMSSETELLMMFAARKEHIESVILPALSKGTWVLCDRFTEATYAYQAFGRKMGLDKIAFLEEWIQQGFRPDRTFWFDLPIAEGLSRIKGRGEIDRFEKEDFEFFDRVIEGYQYLYRARSTQITRIDAQQPIADITHALQKEIHSIL